MDETPDSFAYRCLPLATANTHGWEIGNSCGFSARWNGGSDLSAVEILLDEGADTAGAPVSLFGQGTITFHISGLFCTEPGWNLWLTGAPNHAKDGIAPLSGLIETDWSPYSFTMNWRFTRPDHWVRFEPHEPIGFFFPVQRGVVDGAEPQLRSIDEAPELKRQFETWSRSRDAFHERMRDAPPAHPSEHWQKLYYRGVDPDGATGVPDHQIKIQPRAFAAPGAARCPISTTRMPPGDKSLAKRDWLLGVQQDLRRLSPRLDRIDRVIDITSDEFLDKFYAANWPVILCGEMADWPALRRWTPEYLVGRVGSARVEALTAEALSPLRLDLGRIDKLLSHDPAAKEGALGIEAEGSFIPLHHDRTNSLLVQIVGRKRIVMAPPAETSRLAIAVHGSSEAGDLLSAEMRARFPDIVDIRKAEITLEPGEILFLPIGWWHQARALDFSLSATYTDFRWRNDWADEYPT